MAHVGALPWLAESADLDLYRHNAFRVSGLPVTATPRAVRRRGSELRAAEALGAEAPPGVGWLALAPPPDHAAVREALRRLDDPLRRVADELFWLWPLPETDGLDLGRATALWESAADPAPGGPAPPGAERRGISLHNLAVLHHASVLESTTGGPDAWRRAYRYWRLALDDESCWRWFGARIEALDDPRLRGVTGDDVRDALPAVLLTIHARLAIDAARPRGGDAAARGHVRIMGEFAPDGTARAVLTEATATIASALRLLIDNAATPADDHETLAASAAALVAGAEDDLRVLRVVLGPAHPVVEGTADAVASGAHKRVVASVNKGRHATAHGGDPDLVRATDTLRRAHAIAATAHVRVPIERDIAVLLADAVVLHCNALVSVDRRAAGSGVEMAERLITASEPRLAELRRYRADPDDPQYDRASDALAAAVCQLVTLYFNATANAWAALPLYERARQFARSHEVRRIIQQNIDVVGSLTGRTRPPRAVPTGGERVRGALGCLVALLLVLLPIAAFIYGLTQG
ncbi:hypothetical protein [Streptomyces sp. PT12]|uniref:hypothetical protein n=1 Tax=Streptomyces sp. PT12 TaxID=1510197 RepID=UPI000DE24A6B|nr:hypothetical protein [Streptomyces sp. PT12]RBM20656.1 hypothetical protein DEH69_06670 [Streptomyces sp. PT12]